MSHNSSVIKSPYALSAWAVDAVSVVRRELERSLIGGGGSASHLPGEGNWISEEQEGEETEWGKVPVWAETDEDGLHLKIKDLKMMAEEVELLVGKMGGIMER